MNKPNKKPINPKFSAGPSSKYEGYNLSNISTELISRSNRSADIVNLVNTIRDKIRAVLSIPKDYKVMVTPGGGTGAMEIALWNLLGHKTVDVLSWDHFGNLWQDDIKNKLKLTNANFFLADFGSIPNMDKVDFQNNDVLFPYLGTASGVKFNQEAKIPTNRKGLIIADSTSHVFTDHVPWDKIDVFTFSWQKALGGEAQHGTVVLSPRAVERLQTYTPNWPIPRLFNIRPNEILEGEAINTPSILCLLDFVESINHFEKQGGLNYGIKKINENFEIIKEFVDNSEWVDFLAEDSAYRSKVAICLKMIHPEFLQKERDEQKSFLGKIHQYLYDNKIAYDIKSYRTAPLGFRIWAGPTINKEDLLALTQWLDYYLKNL